MPLRTVVFWLHLLVGVTAGAVILWESFAGQSPGRRLRAWVRRLNTGEAGGRVGRAIALVASAGGVVLVWTGIALARRRFRSCGGGVPSPEAGLASGPAKKCQRTDRARQVPAQAFASSGCLSIG